MQTTLDRKESQPFFILLLVVLLLIAIGRMIEPFVGVLLSAILAYLLCLPTYKKLEKAMPRRSPAFRAAVADFLAFVFLLIPVFLLTWAAVNQAREIGPAIKEWNDTLEALKEGRLTPQLGWVRPVRSRIAEILGMTSWEVQNWLIQNIRPWVERFDTFLVSTAKNAIGLLSSLFFFLLVLFFLFRDGTAYYRRLRDILPLEMEYQDKLFTRINYSLHVILRGWFLNALLQGGVSTLGFTLVGLPGAALLGLLAAIASIIPFVGTSLVWGPAVLILLVQGAYGKGLFLLAWGAGMVGMIDNIAAPWIMGERMHMPLPFLLFAILGGVALFGFKGLLLGPLIVSIAPTLLEIYKERFLSRKGSN